MAKKIKKQEVKLGAEQDTHDSSILSEYLNDLSKYVEYGVTSTNPIINVDSSKSRVSDINDEVYDTDGETGLTNIENDVKYDSPYNRRRFNSGIIQSIDNMKKDAELEYLYNVFIGNKEIEYKSNFLELEEHLFGPSSFVIHDAFGNSAKILQGEVKNGIGSIENFIIGRSNVELFFDSIIKHVTNSKQFGCIKIIVTDDESKLSKILFTKLNESGFINSINFVNPSNNLKMNEYYYIIDEESDDVK